VGDNSSELYAQHATCPALRFAPYRAQPDRITLSLALQCETYRNRTGTQCAAPWIVYVAYDSESHVSIGERKVPMTVIDEILRIP